MPFHGINAGSNPVGGIYIGDVVQLVEPMLCKHVVVGSSPVVSIILYIYY
jgi:hypothetical protein